MRSTKLAAAVLALVLLGPGLWASTAARAEGPAGGQRPTVLEGMSLGSQLPGHSTITLSARLLTGGDRPERGAQLLFYDLSTVFGERLMMLGSAMTDATGTASLPYEPTWKGQHTVVVRYAGDGVRAPAQTILRFESTAAPHVHDNASFGLATPRRWAPLGAGLAVLGVWGVLGLALVRTVLGIMAAPAAAPAAAARTGRRSLRSVPLPAQLQNPLIPGLALLVVIALFVGLVVPRTRGSVPGVAAVPVSSESHDIRRVVSAAGAAPATSSDGNGVRDGRVLAARLIQSIPAFSTDELGNVAPDSPDLPAGVAVVGNHIFVLDTNRGRVLTVAADGQLARIFESDPDGGMSVAHAVAMTAHDGAVFVAAPLFGSVVQLSTAGQVKGVIQPLLPKAAQPFRPGGIAVTTRGDIWLSDSNNDRVVLVSGTGTPLATIGNWTADAGGSGPGTTGGLALDTISLDKPGGIAIDSIGRLWVVDTGNHEVKEYSSRGTFLRAIGRDALLNPQDIAIDASDRIFVTDQALREVRVFGADGVFLGSIGKSEAIGGGSGGAGLEYPRGIAISGDRIYVMDRLSGMFVFELGPP
jgi:sugar lactone lactonase YvrE